jgi:carbonic anhydrase/acetyltransferase-like protein (isoleucine patch superfamily)
MLAAGSLLTRGQRVPQGELWAGRPAKFMRAIPPEQAAKLATSSARYVELSRAYLSQLEPS